MELNIGVQALRMHKGRGLLELIFVILMVSIIAGLFPIYLIKNLNEARSVALENQLTNIRYSLELYRMLEGSYPVDLRELNRKYVTIKEDSLYGRKYLELQSQDKEGNPIDPYGRRFIYNSKDGSIKKGESK